MSDEKHAEATQARFAASAERMAEHEESRREELRAGSGLSGALRRRARAGRGRRDGRLCVRRRAARQGGRRRRRGAGSPGRGPVAGRAGVSERDVRRGRRRGPSVRGRIVRPRRSRARCTTSHVRSSSSSQLTRVIGFSGQVLIVDQIAPIDPLAGFELDRFERARDLPHAPAARRRHPLPARRERPRAPPFPAAPGGARRGRVSRSGGMRRPGAAGCALRRSENYTATIGWYLAARQPMSA